MLAFVNPINTRLSGIAMPRCGVSVAALGHVGVVSRACATCSAFFRDKGRA
jgi:hypothetical protein